MTSVQPFQCVSGATYPCKTPPTARENLIRLCSATIGQTGWRMVQVWSYPVSVKGGSAFGGNPQTEKPVEIQEVSSFLSFLTRTQLFARRLFYALSGFNHDAHFGPSSFSTVI